MLVLGRAAKEVGKRRAVLAGVVSHARTTRTLPAGPSPPRDNMAFMQNPWGTNSPTCRTKPSCECRKLSRNARRTPTTAAAL
jgi:hypothetical protein